MQMYNQIMNQRVSLKLDLQMKEKDIARKAQKLKEFEEQIKVLKDDSNLAKQQCSELKDAIRKFVPNCEEILSKPIFSQMAPSYNTQPNVVKSLRGGGGARKTVGD